MSIVAHEIRTPRLPFEKSRQQNVAKYADIISELYTNVQFFIVAIYFTLISSLFQAKIKCLTLPFFFSPDPSCDFEKDLCSWKQLTTDDFDWTRNKGKTSSDGTGPSTDHSGNGTKY